MSSRWFEAAGSACRPGVKNGRSRGRSRLQTGREIGLARLEQQAQLESAKVQAVGYVGHRGISVLAPAMGQAVERARIEREVAEASWRIHNQATQAFGQMLDAAREAKAHDVSEEP